MSMTKDKLAILRLKGQLMHAWEALEACEKASGFVPGDTPLPVWIDRLHDRFNERESWWRRRYASRIYEIEQLKKRIKK